VIIILIVCQTQEAKVFEKIVHKNIGRAYLPGRYFTPEEHGWPIETQERSSSAKKYFPDIPPIHHEFLTSSVEKLKND